MKTLIIAAALLAPAAAVAQNTAAAPSTGASFHARLYDRYCDKLREGPEAYVQFVKRMQPVHGLTFTDFAPENRGDPVKADCKVAPERVAAVQRELKRETR
jgi:hypothetical protein